MTKGSQAFFIGLSLCLLLAGCSSPKDSPAEKPTNNHAGADQGQTPKLPPPPKVVARSDSGPNSNPEEKIPEPEATVIKLIIAIMKADKNEIISLLVPGHDEGIAGELCWKGKGPDDVIQEAETHPEQILPGLQRLKPGDVATVLKTRIDVKDSDISDDRILIHVPKMQMVFVLVRANGVWKVDLGLIVDAAKANSIARGTAKKLEEPEQAVVDFMFAMIKGDKDRIEALIVPNPESAILLEGEHAPESQLPAIEAELRLVPYKRLKPGDAIPVGHGKTHVIDESEINENRMMISDPKAPLPFILVRIDGKWKVDAGPIIAGRKAAAAARKAHQSE